MNRKIFIPIILGLILIISAVVVTKSKVPQKTPVSPPIQSSPTITNQNPGWQTFKNDAQKITYRYPQNLPNPSEEATTYIRPQKWPPEVTVSPGTFSCHEGGPSINGRPNTTVQKTMHNTQYCIESLSEGAAGTTYKTYTYSFQKGSKLVKLSFTLAYPECSNYPEPQKTACEQERQSFDPDSLIASIAESLRF